MLTFGVGGREGGGGGQEGEVEGQEVRWPGEVKTDAGLGGPGPDDHSTVFCLEFSLTSINPPLVTVSCSLMKVRVGPKLLLPSK